MRRRTTRWRRHAGFVAASSLLLALAAPASAAVLLDWQVVANNADLVPGDTRTFNSYSPPSVNNAAQVVFRARSRSGQQGGQPATGIFSRDMATLGPITSLAQRGEVVPAPNNTGATFNEFPAFARIDARSGMAATRGQSQPVWEVIDPGTGETLTRLGTAGIYVTPNGGALATGMAGLGGLPAFSQFQVPTAATGGLSGVKFDQFPGSPSPFNGQLVAFKGNFNTPDGARTGVFYRDTVGTGAVVPVAYSGQALPSGGGTFGSTAPPSAAAGQIVFTGLDNEEAPTAGGIYRARIGQPGLSTVVAIGQAVPGVTNPSGNTFNRIGEALSFDGRRVAFWGAWGTETRTISLTCPGEGQAAVIQSCIDQSGGDGVTEVEVPVHQGIFLADVVTGDITMVADTGGEFQDFLFWTFSGRPPGTGGGDEGDEEFEEPRWRSSAFLAAEGSSVAFKASEGDANPFGIYFDRGAAFAPEVVVDSTMLGQVLDVAATDLPITALSLERDGMRNGRLAIGASMASDETGWAGVYLADVPVPEPATAGIFAAMLGLLGAIRRRGAAA
jgi:hypothetical protein